MVGATPVVTRLVLAVSGVGALIWLFFGVSVRTLLLRLLEKPSPLDFDELGVGVMIFFVLPADTNGCRRAAWGFIRRSGSQTKHFEMKSTNSSSSHRRTWARVLEPGLRRRPLEFTTGRGDPLVSTLA